MAIRIRDLTKRYGEVEAIHRLDLDVPAGELFGFLGPNGAGKSTTIKILCALAEPTAGTATVAGYDVVEQRAAVRRAIGLVFQEPTLDGYLTAEQNLRFHGELYGVPRAQLPGRIDEMLDLVGLAERRHDLAMALSGGQRRRLEIARGLLHSPQVLFLDEPTVGLDPQTRASIWEHVADLRQRTGITVFVTTHYLEEAEHCDRIAIMDRGRIVALDTPEALRSGIGADRVQLSTDDDDLAIARLEEHFGVPAAMHSGLVTFAVPGGAGFVPRLFAELGVGIATVTVTRPSLDDVFMNYTGRTLQDSGAAAPRRGAAMVGGRR